MGKGASSGISFEEYMRKKTEDDEEQVTTSKVSGASSGKSFDDFVYEKYIGSQVDASTVQNWFTEADALLNSTKDYVSKNQDKYNASYGSEYTSQIKDLNRAADSISVFLEQNKDNIEDYDSLYDAFSQYQTYFDDFKSHSSSVRNYYSQWESEDAYKEAMEAQKEREEWLAVDLDALAADMSFTEDLVDLITEYRIAASNASSSAPYGKDKGKGREYDLERQMWFYGISPDDEKSLKAKLDASKQKYNTAKKVQDEEATLSKLRGVTDHSSENYDPEYDAYVEKGASVENPSGVYGTKEKDIKNPVTYVLDHKYDFQAGGNRWAGYDPVIFKMSDEQINNYNYLFGKYGREEADKYLEIVRQGVRQEKATDFYEKWLEGNALTEMMYSVAVQGTDQFFSNMGKLMGSDYSDKRLTDPQLVGSLAREDLKDTDLLWYNLKEGKWEEQDILGSSLGQTIYDLGVTTGNMAPSLAAGFAADMVLPGSGAIVRRSLMGLSSGSGAYQEALNLGYTKDQALVKGVLVGASEAYLDHLLDGVVGDSVVGKKLSKVVSGLDDGFSKFALEFGGSIASEAFEEGLQEVLTPLFDNIAFNTSNGFEDIDWSQVAYSALLGGLSGGAFHLGGVGIGKVKEGIATKADGKSIIQGGGVDALVALANELAGVDGVNDLSSLVSNVNGTNGSNARAVGKLSKAVDKVRTQQNKADIVKALEAKGISSAKANRYANILLEMNSESSAFTVGTEEQLKKAVGNTKDLDVILSVAAEMESSVNSRNRQHNLGRVGLKENADGSIVPTVSLEEEVLKENYSKQSESIKAEVAEDGKTKVISTDAEVTLKGIDHIETEKVDGKTEKVGYVKVADADGNESVVKVSDVKFASRSEAVLYDTFVAMDIDPAHFDAYIKNFNEADFDGNLGEAAMQYATGFFNAYRYGWVNDEAGLSKNMYASKLTDSARDIAYTIGKESVTQKVEAKQKALDAAVQERKDSGKGKVRTKGKLHMDGVKTKKRTDAQKVGEQLAKRLTSLGIDVYLFESHLKNGKWVDDNGVEVNENGYYVSKYGSIHVDINAGRYDHSIMAFTLSHELAHWAIDLAPREGKIFADLLVKWYGKKGVSVKDQVEQIMVEDNLDFDGAYEELIARSCESFLTDSNIAEKISELQNADKKTWEIIRDKVLKFLEWMKSLFKDIAVETEQGQIVREMSEAIDELHDAFYNVIASASDTAQWVGVRDISSFAEAKTTDGDVLFQHRAMEADKEIYRDMLLKHGQMSAMEISTLFNTVDKAMDVIKSNLEALDYAWEADIDDRAFSPVKPNSDNLYKVSLDFSTLCRKRILQQLVQARLQEALNKQLSREESIAIRDELMKIQEEGRQIEIACALCYVESARMKSPAQITKFLENREAVITEFLASKSGGSIKQKIKQAEADARDRLGVGDASLKSMPKKVADQIRAAKKQAKKAYQPTAEEQKLIDVAMKMSVSDFTSAEGLESLAKNYPVLFDAYTSYIRNATKSKGIENDTWWRAGDSASIGDTLIANMNRENGLRSQSWSDFQVIHLLDYIAATIELSTRNAKEQAYSKVPDYIELMGNTGVMLNMSLIPASVFNGKLEYDAVEGIDYKKSLALRDKYHATAGTICIGMDNGQIKLLLADGTIDYVIPYHKSGMAAHIRKLMHIPDWTDYEDYQSEAELSRKDAEANAKKYGVTLLDDSDPNYHKHTAFSEWFDLEVAQQITKMENANPSNKAMQKKYGVMYGGYMAMQDAANNYLKLCAERGLSPKFSHENADFTSEENYWKLLIDRKMVDNVTGEIIVQQSIKPIFDEGEVLRILNDELERYPKVKADQEYAVRTVMERFLSGKMNSRLDADTIASIMQKPVDNVTMTNIVASTKYDAILSAKMDIGTDGIKKSTRSQSTSNGYGTIREILAKQGLDEWSKKLGGHFPLSASFDATMRRDETPLVMGTVQAQSVARKKKDSAFTVGKNAFRSSYGIKTSVHINQLNIDADLYTDIANESISKANGKRDEQILLDVIPHYKDILANSVFMAVERLAHTKGKGTALYGYRLYNLYWYIEGGKKTPHCLVSTVVQNTDSAEGYVFRDIENVTIEQGLLGNKADMSPPLNSDNYTIAQLYKFVKRLSRDEGGLKYTPEEQAKYGFSYTTRNDGVKYSKRQKAPTFYSYMGVVVDGVKQDKLGAASVINMLKGKGVKDEEIKWSGIETWLEGKKSVTKAELQEFIAGSQLQIDEDTLDNKDRPYTADQQKRLDEYESKRDEVAKRLADEWKKVTGDEFPIRNAGAGLESAVTNAIIDANLEKKTTSFEGRLLEKLQKDLKEVIAKNDDFGFDSVEDALRSIHRHRRDFIRHYEMSTKDKAVIVKYCNALNAYNELPNSISDADTDKLRAIASEEDQWNRKILKVRREHNEESSKYIPKWDQYSLKGGKNYREVLFRIPESTYSNKAMYAHWEERHGVLAHARVQDFVDADGNTMLFVEELQSDWHNEGAKKGYVGDESRSTDSAEFSEYLSRLKPLEEQFDSLYKKWLDALGTERADSFGTAMEKVEDEMDALAKEYSSAIEKHNLESEAVPDAPFRDTYHEYVLKRLLRMAAEDGYDSIGWTTADTQMDRWNPKRKTNREMGIEDAKNPDAVAFEDGYRIEYDQDIPKFLRKYGKKWGATVGKSSVSGEIDVWSMPITDSMKDSVLYDGQVMYSRRGSSLTARSLLANALDGAAQNEIEARRLSEYKAKIDLINAEEQKLYETREKIAELSFAKGTKDTVAINNLQETATRIANRINTYDKQLLNLEATAPLKAVLEREKDMVRKREKQRAKEAMAEYREQSAKTLREVMNRNTEARKKGVESRKKTEIRHKIKDYKAKLERTLLNPTDRQFVPVDLIKAMVDVCDLIDTDTSLYKADGELNKAQVKRNLTKERLQALKDEYENLKTNSDPVYAGEFDDVVYEYLKDLRDKFGGKNLNDMSLDELNEMYYTLRAISDTLQDARKLIGREDMGSVYEVGDSIVAEQNAITAKRKKGKRSSAEKAKDWTINLSLSPVRNVERMSGYNQDSYLRALFSEFEIGIRRKNKFVMESYKSFEHLTSGKEYEDAVYKEYGKEYVDINGRKFHVSKMQMMQAILSHDREVANHMNHIQSGGFTFADLDMLRKGKLKDAISEEYSHRIPSAVQMVAEFRAELKGDKWCQEYMKVAREFFDGKAKDAINETSIALKHRIIARDKSYIPFEVDKNFVVREISAENDIQQTINSYGMLKSKKDGAPQALIITGLNNILDRHIDQVGSVHGLAIPVRNFNKVWNVRSLDVTGNDPTVKTAIQRNWGVGGVEHIEQAVRDIQGSRPNEQSAIYKFVKSGYISSTFTLNLSVVTKQIGSLFSATSMLRWRDPVRMMGNLVYTMANHKKISAEVDKYTASAWMRRQGMSDAELHTLTTMAKKPGLLRALSKAPAVINPVKWITAMDHAVALSLWRYAKIDTAKRTGLKGEALLQATAAFYDDVIENTQSMSDVLHRPEIQKRGDVVSEAFGMFKTDLYQMAGQLQTAAGRYGANKTKENGQALARTAYSVLMSAMWGQLMTTLWALLRYKVDPYRDDEDEELTTKSWLDRQSFSFFGDLAGYFVPLFGSEVVGVFENIKYGESDDLVDSIALTAINDLYDIMITVATSVKDGEMPKPEQMKKFTIKALQLFKIPANNILRTIDAIKLHAEDIANGEFLSFEAGVNRTPANEIHRIIELVDADDLSEAKDLYEEIVEDMAMEIADGDEYGKAELNEAKSKLKTALGEKYKAGKADEDTVRDILSKLFGMDDEEIYWTFDKWDYAVENGSSEDYAKYDDFISAVKKGRKVDDEINRYTKNGVEMDSLKTALGNAYKEDELSRSAIEDVLSRHFDLEDDDIYWMFDKWDYAKQNGTSEGYSKYAEFFTAVESGKNLKTTIKRYTDHGVDAKTLASQITKYFKPLYIEMSKSERASIKGYLLNAYVQLGYNRSDKSKDIDKWLN